MEKHRLKDIQNLEYLIGIFPSKTRSAIIKIHKTCLKITWAGVFLIVDDQAWSWGGGDWVHVDLLE